VTPSLVGVRPATCTATRSSTSSDRFPDWETGSVLALFLIGVVALLTVFVLAFLQPQQVVTE